MYLLMKFRKSQTKFSRNSRKISLQFQRISKKESGICMIIERREIDRLSKLLLELEKYNIIKQIGSTSDEKHTIGTIFQTL